MGAVTVEHAATSGSDGVARGEAVSGEAPAVSALRRLLATHPNLNEEEARWLWQQERSQERMSYERMSDVG